MNAEEFIAAIKSAVVDDSIESVTSNLVKQPGRNPAKEMIEMSKWFNKLNIEEKKIVEQIIKESVETSVFGFLCVLDGVRPIEEDEIKRKLSLYFEKDGNQELLNAPEED